MWISAIVLAAGQSKRMGQPKMLLPWGKKHVISASVAPILDAGVNEAIVVCGEYLPQIDDILANELPTGKLHTIFNPDYKNDDLLTSLKIGMSAISPMADAILLCLGDQPQLETSVVASILSAYRHERSNLVVPSWQNRRGHPWLISKALFEELGAMGPEKTLRDLLTAFADQIEYVEASPCILKDIDTPEQYIAENPDSPKP